MSQSWPSIQSRTILSQSARRPACSIGLSGTHAGRGGALMHCCSLVGARGSGRLPGGLEATHLQIVSLQYRPARLHGHLAARRPCAHQGQVSITETQHGHRPSLRPPCRQARMSPPTRTGNPPILFSLLLAFRASGREQAPRDGFRREEGGAPGRLSRRVPPITTLA